MYVYVHIYTNMYIYKFLLRGDSGLDRQIDLYKLSLKKKKIKDISV